MPEGQPPLDQTDEPVERGPGQSRHHDGRPDEAEAERRGLEVTDVENAFVFHVESDGSMPVEELVLRAVDTLADRADELEAAVSL